MASTVTIEELRTFHKIDRELYSLFVINLFLTQLHLCKSWRYSSRYTETSTCVTPIQNSVALTSISKPVFQAFSLLETSLECQDAVASIASDKIIWDAVMRNPKVQDFIKSRQASVVLTDMDNMEDANDSFLDNEKASVCVDNEDDEKHHGEDTTNGFTELIQKIKVRVTDMSSNLYGIVLSIIGGPKEEKMSLGSNGAASPSAIEKSTAASLMALAVMAIMVIFAEESVGTWLIP